MSEREELEQQLKDVFGQADYPINNVMELLPVLPQGPNTQFTAGEKSWSAMELSQKLSSQAEFPYHDVDSFVKDVLAGLENAGEL